MKTVKSNSRWRALLFIVLLYLMCLALVLLVRPVWNLIQQISYWIDDVLNATGFALADGEYDPAALWVILGVPLIVAAIIGFLTRRFR